MLNRKNIITITYKVAWHGHHSHYQNANRYAHSRAFRSIDEAREFAKTVEVISAVNGIGQIISL